MGIWIRAKGAFSKHIFCGNLKNGTWTCFRNLIFSKWKYIFLEENLILNSCPWVPLTFLIKSSSETGFFFVRRYARSGFAFTEKSPNRFRSTHVERDAQSMRQVGRLTAVHHKCKCAKQGGKHLRDHFGSPNGIKAVQTKSYAG